jgi:putative intracellular protease/amidase
MPELADAERILREHVGSQLRVAFPLAPMTSFRIGGPAALFVEAQDDDALRAVGRAFVETAVPIAVIGKGSNILVSDGGFAGIVVRLGRGYRWAARAGDLLTAASTRGTRVRGGDPRQPGRGREDERRRARALDVRGARAG